MSVHDVDLNLARTRQQARVDPVLQVTVDRDRLEMRQVASLSAVEQDECVTIPLEINSGMIVKSTKNRFIMDDEILVIVNLDINHNL